MRRIGASATLLLLLASILSVGAPVAHAASDPLAPDRTDDRELVTVDMTADGNITRTSLVDSLSVYGNGAVRVTDVNEPAGLRNLSGFAKPSRTSGLNVTWDLSLAGRKEILTVAPSIPKAAPVRITPRYFIGGTQVKASKLVGYSGDVTIEYVLANTTKRVDNLTVTDSHGAVTTVPLETYVPMVGQVLFELPDATWRSIDAPGATIVTDDNNLHHVTFTAILAPLVGSVSQTVRLSGRVRDLSMAQTRIVFQPLLPGTAEDTAQATASGAGKLFSGIGEVDANLGKLQQGTLELVGGLEQLYQGIVDARTGVGSVGKTNSIVDGMKRVLDGLKSLGDAKAGVPAIKAGVDQLVAGVGAALAGLGSAATSGTILNGLSSIGGGLGALGASSGLPAAKAGVDAVSAGLATAKSAITGLSAAIGGSVAEITGAEAVLGCPGSANPACPLLDSALNSSHGLSSVTLPGMASLASGTDAATAGLGAVSAGLGSAIGAVSALGSGVAAVTAGVESVRDGLKSGDPKNPGILEGLESVANGLTQVVSGIGTVGAADTLTDGANRLLSGSESLGSGLDKLAAGGADARSGAAQIGSGQGALSSQGTKALLAGVGDNVQQASAALAVLTSMRSRAADGSALYGPPPGGSESSTYVFRVGEITADNVVTVLKFAIGAVLLALLIAAGANATRRATISAV